MFKAVFTRMIQTCYKDQTTRNWHEQNHANHTAASEDIWRWGIIFHGGWRVENPSEAETRHA